MKKTPVRPSAIFWLLYLAYTAIYIARLNLSMASPAMREAGILTATELGFIGSAFSVIFSCGRLFNGILGDRLAPKILIFTGLVLTGLSNLLIGILPPYLLILTLWCLNAFGQSMLWSALLRTMSTLYGKDGADKKTPILVSSVSVGNILGILLGSWLVSRFGVSMAFIVPGAMTVLCGLAVLYIVPPAPKAQSSQRFPLKALLSDRRIRGILLPAMFHGTMKDNISLWMAVYFLDRFAVDLESSAWYVLLIPVVGLAGRLLYPACYKLSKGRENLISVLSFIACALLGIALCLPATPLLAAVYLSLIYALVSLINTSFLSMFPLRFVEKGLVSSVSGIADFATYLGAGIASAVYGFFIDRGPTGYTIMFISWAVLSVASVLLLLPQHPFRKEDT